MLILDQVLVSGEAPARYWFIRMALGSSHWRTVTNADQLPVDVVAVLVTGIRVLSFFVVCGVLLERGSGHCVSDCSRKRLATAGYCSLCSL